METHKILNYAKNLPGWCDGKKAVFLHNTCMAHEIHLAMEIGVYGGCSLLPIAAGVAHENGLVYGIDPYSNVVATTGTMADKDRDWWGKVNLDDIRGTCLTALRYTELEPYVALIRRSSNDIRHLFQPDTFGLIHIDGNHSEEQSLADVQLAYDLLDKGGWLVFDDIDWNTTAEAQDFLANTFRFTHEFSELTWGVWRKL